MKIGINCLYLNRPQIGIGRYIHNLICGLSSIESEHTFYLITPSDYSLQFNGKHIHYIIAHLKTEILDEYSWSKYLLKHSEVEKLKLDLLFVPFNQFTITYNNIKILTTIHDIIPILPIFINRTVKFPALFNFTTVTRFSRLIYTLLKMRFNKHYFITTVSNFTSNEINKIFHYHKDKIFTIHNSIDQDYWNNLISSDNKLRINERYLLFVGSAIKRKNVESVIKAFNIIKINISIKIKLVLVGSFNKPGPAQTLIKKYNLINDVIIYESITDKELSLLYNNAMMLVFPSYYEGFGLPVLEAITCGCPVIASDNSSLPEVLEDVGLYINPFSVSDIVSKIESILYNVEFRQKKIQEGILQSSKYEVKKTSQKLFEMIERIVLS